MNSLYDTLHEVLTIVGLTVSFLWMGMGVLGAWALYRRLAQTYWKGRGMGEGKGEERAIEVKQSPSIDPYSTPPIGTFSIPSSRPSRKA
jgi:hypothetical protein